MVNDGKVLTVLYPQRRLYVASGTPSTEMAIDAGFFRDLFVTLGEEKSAGAWSMTLYVKPLCAGSGWVPYLWRSAVRWLRETNATAGFG